MALPKRRTRRNTGRIVAEIKKKAARNLKNIRLSQVRTRRRLRAVKAGLKTLDKKSAITGQKLAQAKQSIAEVDRNLTEAKKMLKERRPQARKRH